MATSALLDAVRRHHRADPRASALRTERRDHSWADLLAESARVADELRAVGVAPGSWVAIATGTGAGFVQSYLGVLIAGASPAVVEPLDADEATLAIARLAPSAVVGALGAARRLRIACPLLSVDVDGIDAGAPAIERSGLDRAPPSSAPPSTLHLLFTSGSSGSPKGIVWSEERALAAVGSGQFWNVGAFGLVVPLTHSAGLNAMVSCLVAGRPLAIVDAPFAMAAAFSAMQEMDVRGFKCTPTHVALMHDAGLVVPRGVERIQVSGAPIAAERLLELVRQAEQARVRQVYGLAEVGLVTVLEPEQLERKASTVGRPRPGGVQIEIRDGDDRLGPGQEGEVVVSTPTWRAGDGYFEPGPELARRFRDGLLFTGDRGFFDEDGFLVLVGRRSELIKSGGKLLHARRIEERLADAPGQREIAVVGVPDARLGQVPVAMYVPSSEQSSERDLFAHALARLPPDHAPRSYLSRRTLPRAASAKLRRGRLREEAEAWMSLWDARLLFDDRLWPSRAVADGLVVVDGLPETVRQTCNARGKVAGRPIAWLIPDNPPVPVAFASVRDGLGACTEGVRIVSGPWLARGAPEGARPLVVRSLLEIALRLPGPPASAVVGSPGSDALLEAAFVAAGFRRAGARTRRYVWRAEGYLKKAVSR